MKILRVRAKNFGCHKEIDIYLQSGINAILGPNGSGKSTILDIIRFGIYGESAAAGTKADNVRWGCDIAETIIDFQHGSVDYCITRVLGKKNKQILITPEGSLTRNSEISEFIESICGATMDAMLNNVFVPQGRIDAILYSSPTPRLNEIQQSIGLNRAPESGRALQAELGRYNITLGLEQQLLLAQESLAEAKDAYQVTQQEMKEVEAKIVELQPYVVILREVKEAQRNSVALQNIESRIVAVKGRLDAAVASQEELVERLKQLKLLVTQQKGVADTCQSQLAQYEADKLALQAVEDLKEQLEETDSAIVKLGVTPQLDLISHNESIDELSAKLSLRQQQLRGDVPKPKLPEQTAAEAELKRVGQELDLLGASRNIPNDEVALSDSIIRATDTLARFQQGRCPTCGQVVKDFDPAEQEKCLTVSREELKHLASSRQQEYDEKKDQLTAETIRLRGVIIELEAAAFKALTGVVGRGKIRLANQIAERDGYLAYHTSFENLKARKCMLEGQLTRSAPLPLAEEEVQKLRKLVEDAAKLSIKVAEHASRTEAGAAVVEQYLLDLTEAKNERVSLGEATSMPKPEVVEDAEAKVSILSAQTLLRANLLQRVTTLEIKIGQLEVTSTSVRKQQEAEQRDAEWVKLCKRAREVLHVSGLPSLLIQEYAMILNRRMQYYLALWEAPFTLELDEKLAFVATFDNGETISSARLSGGQKVVAGISLRFAMADTFARKLGLLILDEPSNHLDAEHRQQHLNNLLMKVKETGGNTQVIIVDHEEALVGSFDHVHTLNSI